MSTNIDYLNPKQREHYQQVKKNAERTLKNIGKSEYHAVRNMDKSLIRQQIKKADKVLDERTAPKLKGKAKDKAWQRYKELQTELHGEMLRKKDMHPTKTIDGGRIVADMDKAKAMAYEQVKRIESGQDDKVREMRNLATMLEPDDPTIRDSEKLRRR